MPIKKIDIGSVEYIGFGQTKEISYFGSNVNIGLGPIIANKANSRHGKYLGDFLGTLVAVIQTVFTFKGITLDVIKDNQKMDYGILLI
jgi:hypothetical protein